MKVFGLWERLTRLKFFDGKEITVEPATQTGASDKVINIPDMAANATQEMVLTDQAQTLTNKTISAVNNGSTVPLTITNTGTSDSFVVNDEAGDTTPFKIDSSGKVVTSESISLGGISQSPGTNRINLSTESSDNTLVITGQNGNRASLSTAALTSSKTYSLPNVSGTIVTTGDSGTITSTMILDGTIVDADISNAAAIDKAKISGTAITAADVGTVTSTMIADGTIVNGDVSSTAAIAGTKISPSFGAQNVQVDAGQGLQLSTSGALNVGTTTNATSVNVGTGSNVTAVTIGNATSTTTVAGNLTVSGTTTTVNSTTLEVADKNILVNKGGSTALAAGAGFTVAGGTAGETTLATVQYDGALASKFKLGASGSEAEVVTVSNSQTLTNKTLTSPTIDAITTSAGSLSVSGTGAVRVPVGTDANRPAGTATDLKGMIRYNDQQDSFEGYNELTGWSSLGGGGASERVSQTNIGLLAVGTPLYVQNIAAGWTEAKADAANTAEVAGVIGRIIDNNTVEVTLAGEVTGVATARFENPASLPVKGDILFLSPTTAGKLTTTEPTVIGHVSKPVGIVHNVTAGVSVDVMFFNMRGAVVGSANARSKVYLNSTTTTIQNIAGYEAGEIAGYVVLDGTTDYRFYVQAQFALNAAGTDWNLSYQTTGDTPPAGFSVTATAATGGSANLIQVNIPAGYNAASSFINFALNAPAIGSSLQIDSANVSFGSMIPKSTAGISVRNFANDTTNLFVSDAGNVGIGTSSPSVTLDLRRGAGIATEISVGGNGNTPGSGNFVLSQAGDNSAYVYNRANNIIAFGTNNTERARIDASGNFIVGAAGSGGAQVRWPYNTASANSRTWAIRNDWAAYGDIAFLQSTTQTGTTFDAKMYLDPNGNLLVGTASAGYIGSEAITLSRNSGTTKWSVGPYTGQPGQFYVASGAGTGVYLTSTSATSWTSNSDERLKIDLKPIENAAEKVTSLRAVTGRYKTDAENVSRAFLIAQDVQKVLPEAVASTVIPGIEDTTEYFGLAYTDTIPLLVAAIKEQQAQIQALRSGVAALRSEIEALKNK